MNKIQIKTHEDFLEVKRQLESAGFPTNGELAAKFWEWSVHWNTCVALAISVMTALGYKPLAGYPLVRAKEQS